MIDDEFKKMQALQKAADDLTKQVYRIPLHDEIVRLANYQNEWQRQFDAIKAVTVSEQLNLRNLLPITANEDMLRLREALEPPSAVAQMMRDIAEDAKRGERMLREMTEGIVSPGVFSGYASLNSMLHDIGVQTAEMSPFARTQFTTSLLAPAEQYGRFLKDTISRLFTSDIDPFMRRALQGSIVLADDVLGTNADIVAMFRTNADIGAMIGTAGITEHSIAPTISAEALVLPFIQREELVAARERLPSLDVLDLAVHSPAHGIAQRANRLVQWIVDVNIARKLKGKRETFTHTDRSVLAVRDVALLVARDSRSLADLLDTLYILLYEAAGDDHLRYLDSEGGELASDECEIVWIIKRLRNYARHDLDHGTPTSIRKKWRALDADLQKLGFDRMPTNESEFRWLQSSLLAMAEAFMAMMYGRIH